MHNSRANIISSDGEVRATLYQPNGDQYGNPKSFVSDSEARDWAKRVRNDCLAQVGPEFAHRFGLDGKWELRIR